MVKIIYNYQQNSSFIQIDREILGELYPLTNFSFTPRKKWLTPFTLLQQFFFLLLNWNKYNVIVSQIAAYHTFLPSILSKLGLKKHIIILHGTESMILKEVAYGNLDRKILGSITSFSIKNATYLLPVSQHLIHYQDNYNKSGKERYNGLQANIKNFKTKYKVIHNGINVDLFRLNSNVRNPNSFITVSVGSESKARYLIKGLDLVFDAAERNPTFQFTIVGSTKIYNYKTKLNNVTIIPHASQVELEKLYNSHSYYLQLSRLESFGLALCESMLCGCIPIVSNVGMMPMIINNCGYVIFDKNPEILNDLLISLPNNVSESDRLICRQNIMENFSLSKRKDLIRSFFNSQIC